MSKSGFSQIFKVKEKKKKKPENRKQKTENREKRLGERKKNQLNHTMTKGKQANISTKKTVILSLTTVPRILVAD